MTPSFVTPRSIACCLAVLFLGSLAGCNKGEPERRAGELQSLLEPLGQSNTGDRGQSIEKVESIDLVAWLRMGRIHAGRGIDNLRVDGDHIAFETVEKRPSLLIDLDMDASRFDTIAIEADPKGDRLIQPKAEWNHMPGEKFKRERRVIFHQIQVPTGDGGATEGESSSKYVTMFAPVGDSENWSGHVHQLSIVPSTPPGVSLRVRSIDLLAVPFLEKKGLLEGQPQERLGPFTIGPETREGLYAGPPFRAVTTVDVPEGGILEFGYGTIDSDWRKPGDGVTLRVTVTPVDTGKSTVVFDRTIDPKSTPAHRGWQDDGRCYLEAYEGREVEIMFETLGSPEGEPDNRYDNFIISNPIVYRPGRALGEYNVVLVSLDTLRADRLSLYGHRRSTSPWLDRFSRTATVFQNASSQAPRTIDSHMSLFTSVYPSSHQMVEATARLNPSFATVTEIFKENEYHTAGFTESGFVGHQYGFQRGFDSYWEREMPEGAGGNVAETFTEASDWIRDNHQKKFMMFLHTYEAHVPYCPPPPYFGLFRDEYEGELAGECVTKTMIFDYNTEQVHPSPHDWEYMVSMYDEEIRYLDEYFGRFLNTLEETGIADETIIVVVSDHGEEFMEHIMFGKHAHAIWQQQLHVPLIFRIPDFDSKEPCIETPVSLVDVAPTLLELTSIRIPSQFRGRSLVPMMRGEEDDEAEPVLQFSENHGYALRASVRGRRYKLIHNYGLTEEKEDFLELYPKYAENLVPYGEFELYDLLEDPREKHNLATERPDVLQEMLAELQQRLERAKAEAKPPRIAALDPAVEEQLRALGYVDEPKSDEGEGDDAAPGNDESEDSSTSDESDATDDGSEGR